MENRKFQSHLAEGSLNIVISNYDLEMMISEHGYLKPQCDKQVLKL